MTDIVAFLTAQYDAEEHRLNHLPKRARELPWTASPQGFGGGDQWAIRVHRDTHGCGALP